MRHNLKDANQKLPTMQLALRTVIAETQPYFNYSSLDGQETEQYTYLAGVLDLLFDESTRDRITNLRKAIENRRQTRTEKIAEAVRSTLSPLEDQGFTFIYPRGGLAEHPFLCVCIGFEVLDFEQAVTQMGIIIAQFASFPHEYDFLYLIPLLKGYRYESEVWRINSQNVRDLAQGKLEGMEWALLPVEAPHGLSTVLPEIRQTSLDELNLVSLFYRIYRELNSIRETMFFVKSKLDGDQPFEMQLAKRYQSKLQQAADKISSESNIWTERMLGFAEGNPAEAEWLDFCRSCFQKIRDISDSLNDDPSTFQSINILQDVEPQMLFGRYLNMRYLS
jgi:hypothetical protein